jgi:hypothetical protein
MHGHGASCPDGLRLACLCSALLLRLRPAAGCLRPAAAASCMLHASNAECWLGAGYPTGTPPKSRL